jgi:acyl carrier protein
MTTDEIRATVLDVIGTIAPEADPNSLSANTSLRDQLDIDSFDFLQLLVRLHERLGVEVPEAEYGRLGSLDDIVRWFADHPAARDERP